MADDGPRGPADAHAHRWRRGLAVLVGGCAGTALRMAVGAMPLPDGSWPGATLTVNLTGALLLGYLVVRCQRPGHPAGLTIPLLGVGLLGSYTTFSVLSSETWQLVVDGAAGLAVGYAAASLVGGLLAAGAGIRLARRRP